MVFLIFRLIAPSSLELTATPVRLKKIFGEEKSVTTSDNQKFHKMLASGNRGVKRISGFSKQSVKDGYFQFSDYHLKGLISRVRNPRLRFPVSAP